MVDGPRADTGREEIRRQRADLFGLTDLEGLPVPPRRPLPPIDHPPVDRPPVDRPPVDRPPVDPPPSDDELARYCRKLLAELEKRCPGLLPGRPLPPGEVLSPIDVGNDDFQALVHSALGVDERSKRDQVVWEQAGSALLVHLGETRVQALDGLILVGLTVEANETGRVQVTIPFAVGRTDRLAGMVVTTEPKPRGPSIIIDRWGESLIATAWRAVLDVIGSLTAQAGVDEEGTPLLPGAIVAENNLLRVVAQAPQVFERGRP
jgi:hypothetical protein